MMKSKVLEFDALDELTEAATTEFVQRAKTAVSRQGRFTVALAGGSTPKSLYALLATQNWSRKVPWANVYLFWGDERHVPPNDPDSNYRMAIYFGWSIAQQQVCYIQSYR
jgi:6-phosphogluconolactonase